MSEIQELFRLRAAVATEAVRNPDFMEALKSDPIKALSEFTGVDYSKVKIKIVEEDGDTITFPVPKLEGDLNADELEAVAGGAGFGIAGTVALVIAAGKAAGAGAVAAGTVGYTTYEIGKGEGAW